MPKKPIDYANGIQYKIVCKDPAIPDCYNGSCCSFKDRKNSHKSKSLNPNSGRYNLKVYQFIREHGGWANWEMIQIEKFPCESNQELRLRERHWFDILKPTLNTNSPMITPEERKKYEVAYYAGNKAEILEKQKEYYAGNKTEILAKNKEKMTCECGCVTTKYCLTKHRKTPKHLHNMDLLK